MGSIDIPPFQKIYLLTEQVTFSYLGRLFFLLSLSARTLFISYGSINVADLIAFLLYVTNLIDPVKKLLNFTEQFQEGVTGFETFYGNIRN